MTCLTNPPSTTYPINHQPITQLTPPTLIPILNSNFPILNSLPLALEIYAVTFSSIGAKNRTLFMTDALVTGYLSLQEKIESPLPRRK